jgi:hypothetical protein
MWMLRKVLLFNTFCLFVFGEGAVMGFELSVFLLLEPHPPTIFYLACSFVFVCFLAVLGLVLRA